MDREINTTNGSYSGRTIDNLQNAVYLRIMTPRGSYWADINLGSLLYTLEREKDVQRISLLAKQYAEQALQPLLDDGRAAAIEVQTIQPHDGRLYLYINVTEQDGKKFSFNCPVKVI